MTTEELVDGFIKHIEQHRKYQEQIKRLIYELEKWQSVAINGIAEEAITAALGKYDLDHGFLSPWA